MRGIRVYLITERFFVFVKNWGLYHPAYLPKFNGENVILNKNGFIF